MSSVFGLNARPEQRNGLPAQRPEMRLELPDHPALLALVHLDHGREQLEMIAGIQCQLLQSQRILRETTSAEADARPQEMRPDPPIQPDALGHFDHVRPGLLADLGDLVDERDARHQRRVRGELDHLGRVDAGAHDRRLERRVETGDGVAVLLLERPHRDPVRVHEVAHRAAFRQKLGVRDVPEVVEPALVEAVADLLACPDRHRRLHHEDRAARELRQLIHDAPDARQVGVARLRRRRVDAHEQEAAAREIVGIEREPQPPGVPLEQLRHVRLVERHLAALQRLDLLRHHVANDHVVAELGEADARDEADPAGAEDAYRSHARTLLGG